MAKALTTEQVRDRFRQRGETISGWAEAHGYPAIEVYRVLGGYYKCHRGKAHQIAVELGIKAAPEQLAS